MKDKTNDSNTKDSLKDTLNEYFDLDSLDIELEE